MQRLHSRRPELESLEVREVPTSYLFVEFGDAFPVVGSARTLTTTIGAFRDVAPASGGNNAIQGSHLFGSFSLYPTNFDLDMTRVNQTATQRAQMLALVQRAYAPFDVTVVGLTATPQTLADGRVVRAATSMADVITNLRGGSTTSKDHCAFFVTPAVGPSNEDPSAFYVGIAPGGTILGEQADLDTGINQHDDISISFPGGLGIFFDANTIAHEAGHAYGLQHSVTTAAPTGSAVNNRIHFSEVMAYISDQTSSFFITRFPMVRGNDNTPGGSSPYNNNDLQGRNASGPLTPADQFIQDAFIGENPTLHYISGTGAHDIITITKNAGSTATVTVQAFDNSTYTTAITVPGTASTTFSYTVNLDKKLLIYGGFGADRIVVDGNLGVAVEIDGMDDTDALVVDGKNAASAVYTPNTVLGLGPDMNGSDVLFANYGGTLALGTTIISFSNFDIGSQVQLTNVASFSLVGSAGVDAVTLANPTGSQLRASGTVNGGVAFVSILVHTGLTSYNVNLGAGNDTLVVSSNLAAITPNLVVDLGAGTDTLDLSSVAAAQTVQLLNLGAIDGFTGATAGLHGTFTNSEAVRGSALAGDTLIGLNLDAIWQLTAADPRRYISNGRGLDFFGFEGIQAGTASDTFQFLAGSSWGGTIDGSSGFDWLDYSAYSASATVNLQTSTATAIAATFVNIEGLVGSNTVDTLVGADASNSWNISGTNGGTINSFFFFQIENLIGASDSDNFNFYNNSVLTGTASGGGGDDSLADFGIRDNYWFVSATNGGSTTFASAFSSIENLLGGVAGDQFFFQNNAILTGSIVAGGGTDWLADQSNRANNWFLIGANVGQTSFIVGNFDSIENLYGGQAADQFFFLNSTSTLSGWLYGGAGIDWIADQAGRDNEWLLLGADQGGVGFLAGGYTQLENLFAGAGNDNFNFADTGIQSGWIYGGAGVNWLNYAAVNYAIAVDLYGNIASLAGGAVQISNVHGSGTGSNLLSGDNLDNLFVTTGSGNLLFGWGGVDVLISGIGVSAVNGGDGEDLLVGGATAYDNDLIALRAIQAEWLRLDIDYSTRVSNLKTGQGFAVGRALVVGATVFMPVALEIGPSFGRSGGALLPTLVGSSSLDFFFSGLLNAIVDVDAVNEFVN